MGGAEGAEGAEGEKLLASVQTRYIASVLLATRHSPLAVSTISTFSLLCKGGNFDALAFLDSPYSCHSFWLSLQPYC